MSRFLPYCFLLLMLFVTASPCKGALPPLVLDSAAEAFPLAGHLEILEDKTGSLTIADVSSPAFSSRFRLEKRAVPSFDFTSSVYWVRFSIVDEAGVKRRWLLELDFPHLEHIDLYTQRPEGGFDRLQAGSLQPMKIREFRHRNPVFPFVVNEPAKTFYLRAESSGRMLMPLTVWSPDAFRHQDGYRQVFEGGYFGAILIMVAYNLFVFLSLRDRNYLYYILDIFCFALYIAFAKGLAIEFSSAKLLWINHYLPMLSSLTIFFGVLFCRNFLSTSRAAPRMDRILKMAMFAAVLSLPMFLVAPPELWKRTMVFVAFFSSCLGMATGVICWRRGYLPARFYVGARVFRFLGLISFMLGVNSVLPMTWVTSEGLLIGSILDVLFSSFGLADRIKLMQREKEEAQAEVIRSNQLASLGELAAGVAHEINTPVNTIINSADLLLQDTDRISMEHDVDVIKKQGRRIAAIIKSLLFFSRLPAINPVPFSVAGMLQGTLDMIGAQLRRKHITLTMQIPSDLADIMVRPQQIEQVFLNLLTNAMHALEERHGDAVDQKHIKIAASGIEVNQRPFVRITFWDNGVGIPAALLATVKKPFFTTKETGTGLGLNICQQIMDEHSGRMSMESTVGEYAQVTVELPVACLSDETTVTGSGAACV